MSTNKSTGRLSKVIAANIREACRANGLDRSALARLAGFSPRRVRNVWTGRQIYVGDLLVVARLTGRSASDFLAETDQ